MRELWKIFPGKWKYEYAVSTTGKVKKLSHLDCNGYVVFDKELNRRDKDTYPLVEIKGLDGIRHKLPVAEMVLETFGRGKRPGPTYRAVFRDGNPENCYLINLRWKDIKKIRNVGPNSGQFTCKYKNILVYSDTKLLRCYDTISDLATEFSENIGTKRVSITSRCGNVIKYNKTYYGLKLKSVDIDEFNKAKSELEKVDYDLTLSNYLKANTPNANREGIKKIEKKKKEALPKPPPQMKPPISKELIKEESKPKTTNVSKDEFMMNLLMAMDKRR